MATVRCAVGLLYTFTYARLNSNRQWRPFINTARCASAGVCTGMRVDVLPSRVSGNQYARWSSNICEVTGQVRYSALSALAHVELAMAREHPDRNS